MGESIVESSTETVLDVAKAEAIKVLHVDDDQGFLKVAKQCLETQGEFEVDTGSSVNEALEKLKKTHYDVVVSDYQMPSKDGLEFLEELREKGNTVPFIVFTGKGREEIAIKALNLGADQYIDKLGDPETVYCELAHSIRVAVERKKAEEALFAERDRLETVTRNVGAGLAIISKDYRTLWANDVLKQIFGDVEGKICYSTYNQRNDICPECGVQEIFETGRARVVHEQVGKDVDGKIIWSEITATPVMDRDGSITGVLELVVPITQRKRAEEELRDSSEKYRSLFANMLNGFAYCKMIFDDKGKPVDFAYLEVNDAFEKLTGLKKEDVIEKKVTEAIPGTEKANPELFDIYSRVSLTGKEEKFETFFKPLNIWLSISVYSPKKGYFIALFENTTERKKAEEALRVSEEKHRVISGITADFVFSCVKADEKGFAIDWMAGATDKIFGYSAKEIKDEGCWKFTVQPQDLPTFEEKVTGLKPGQTSVCELRITHKDGSTRWIKVSSQVVKDSSNPADHRLFGACEDITEGKKMDEEIKSLARFPSENPNPVFRISQDSRILFVNDAGKALLKKLNCEVSGSVPTFLKNLTVETLKSKSRRSEESKIEGRIYGFYAMPVVDKGYVNVYGIDITERKQATEEIGKSSEEWKRTFDAISDLVFILDTNFRFVKVNKATCDALKKEPNELIGKRCFEVLHGTDKPWPNCPYKEAFVTKKAEMEEVSDPNIGFPLLVTVSPIFDEKGEFSGVVHVAKDITKLKDTEEHLKKVNKRLEMIYENAMEGISIVDPKGNFVFVNKASANLLGYEKNDLIGMNLSKIFDKEGLEKIRSETGKRKKGKSERYELVFYTRDGERRVARVSASPIWEEDGTFAGTEAIVMDITSQKKTEEELCRAMEKLGMMNEKLRVVGGLTRHDANNKLAAVKGNVYLARKKLSGNSEVLDYLKQIEASIEQTVRIFDFAKAYEMLGVEELAYVDVEKTVDEAVSLFPSLKDIKVMNDCHGLTVLADSLLRQLFYNLIDNSLKYGEKLSWIRVYYEEKKGGHLNVIYEDNGVGVPHAAKPKLFGEGYTTGKGSGYGLYLIKKMVEVYGWTIQETGKQGKGAQFTLTIPRINKAGKENYKLS